MTFATEETKKRVEILITDDKNIEYDENFFLYLTSGEGVHLSPFSTAEVVIKNDDGEEWTCILQQSVVLDAAMLWHVNEYCITMKTYIG